MAAANPFRFSTKYWDSDTKLAYYGFRYYGPGVGSWLSRDPMEGASQNVYGFLKNNPATHIDPFGLWDYNVHYGWTRAWAEKEKYQTVAAIAVLLPTRELTPSGAIPDMQIRSVSVITSIDQAGVKILALNDGVSILVKPKSGATGCLMAL
jgi:RHS repeat-associated protein